MAITKATASAVAPAAKGDLVVGSATNDAAVLGVGTDGQYLTAASTTATGLQWSTLSAGGMTLISTTTLSGSSVTISSIATTYKHLLFVGTNVSSDSTGSGQDFSFRFNGDSSSVYTTFGIYTNSGGGAYNNGNVAQGSGKLFAIHQQDSGIQTGGFVLWMYDYNKTGFRMGTSIGGRTDAGNANFAYQFLVNYGGSDGITSATFFIGGGSFDSGQIKTYGVS